MGMDMIHDFKLGVDSLQLEEGFTGSLGLTESGRNTMINIIDGEDETATLLSTILTAIFRLLLTREAKGKQILTCS